MIARRLSCLALVALIGACSDATPPPTQPAIGIETRPHPAPVDHSRPTLRIAQLDGKIFDLAQHRGRFVVINFWATWCGPCLKEMPELSALARRGDVDVVGIAYESIESTAMQDFLAKRPVAYPIAILDPFETLPGIEMPRGLPMTLLIAPDGRLVMKTAGAVTTAAIDEAIARNRPPSA